MHLGTGAPNHGDDHDNEHRSSDGPDAFRADGGAPETDEKLVRHSHRSPFKKEEDEGSSIIGIGGEEHISKFLANRALHSSQGKFLDRLRESQRGDSRVER